MSTKSTAPDYRLRAPAGVASITSDAGHYYPTAEDGTVVAYHEDDYNELRLKGYQLPDAGTQKAAKATAAALADVVNATAVAPAATPSPADAVVIAPAVSAG